MVSFWLYTVSFSRRVHRWDLKFVFSVFKCDVRTCYMGHVPIERQYTQETVDLIINCFPVSLCSLSVFMVLTHFLIFFVALSIGALSYREKRADVCPM